MAFLQQLDLHRNELNGTIPPTLGRLIRLQFLDLSENLLSGSIPPSLANLTLLSHFNLSHNNLTGAIPPAPSIQRFGPSAFSHNPFLCGFPLNTLCSDHRRRAELLSATVIIAIAAAALILSGVCVIAVMNRTASKKKKKKNNSEEEEEEEEEETLVSESTAPSNAIVGKLVLFSQTLPSRYEDWESGTKALLDSDCLIGRGSIGAVYKASFDSGVAMAVKKLATLGRIRNQEEFEQEMTRIGALTHPHLVALHGYYYSPAAQLMVSEFVPNGSLHEHLHERRLSNGGRGQLNWGRRLEIAVGTAKALAFLHHECKPRVVHLNVKCSNVLVGGEWEAKLSDYGLGKMMGREGGEKGDVFGFGMVVLEMATGRRGEGVREMVRRGVEGGEARGCVDGRMEGVVEEEVLQVIKLGLLCAGDAPEKRPSMGEVLQFLESIRSTNS